MKQNLPTETAQPKIKRWPRGFPRRKSQVRRSAFELRRSTFDAHHPEDRRPAASEYLDSFLGAVLALALLVTGCAGPAPLKGGKAVTTHRVGGVVEQTLVQGENPSQATKQDQESVKVRSYTVPAGSRVEVASMGAGTARPCVLPSSGVESGTSRPRPSGSCGSSTLNSQLSTINPQPSSAFIVSAPMPVVEREETHARTELGAAQKDTARELGARLSSLKGVVWVGVGLFVFGLASLVWPPLKVIISSVTTSAALMLGGVALMVLPSLIVGNELLILAVVGVAVGAWFLAHRHGHLRGLVAASSGPLGGRASSRALAKRSLGSRGRSPSQGQASPADS
jgi:hypothetical protein